MMGVDRNRAREWVELGARQLLGQTRENWRLLLGGALAVAGIYLAIDISDRQGRFDLPSGYAVRMTCEPDPESPLWNGGCDRIAADIARTDRPGFLELYRAFVSVHHREIPSPETNRRFEAVPCDPGFDTDAALRGTRYVFIPLRRHFETACTKAEVEAVEAELDQRDRALLTIERAGLSNAALYAGALANLTEPLAIFAAAIVVAALLIL
jgi:hypothetical protein